MFNASTLSGNAGIIRNQLRKSISTCNANPSSSSCSSCSSSSSSGSNLSIPPSQFPSQFQFNRNFSSSTTSKKNQKNFPLPGDGPIPKEYLFTDTIPSPQLTPRTSSNPTTLAQFFHDSIHKAVQLPNKVALQAVTHESWEMGLGREGNNRRLAFIGRRALKFYLTLFLSSLIHLSPSTSSLRSSSTKPSEQEIEAISSLLSNQEKLEKVLYTAEVLGDRVGRELLLERVMRWRAAMGEDSEGSGDGASFGRESGLYKIRGTCLEGIIGAIYHHQGALITSQVFHAKLLPLLLKASFPKTLKHSKFMIREVERRRSESEKALNDSILESSPSGGLADQDGMSKAIDREGRREEIRKDAQTNDTLEKMGDEESLEEELNDEIPQVERTTRGTSSASNDRNSSATSSVPPHPVSGNRDADATSP